MRILVTGSSGMVGRFLVAELKNRKHSVKEFDATNGHDVLDMEEVQKAVKGADAVFHLAAVIENENPKLWEVNVKGTENLIGAAIKAKVRKFVLLSSTGVYGFTKKTVDEKSPLNPENKYEESKLAAERAVFLHKNEIDAFVVRSAMILGPNKYWAKMFKMIRKKMPLPCDGKNSFQVIHVKDVANGLIAAMQKGKSGEIYLLGGDEKITLNEFCEIVQEKFGLKKGMKHIPEIIALIIGKILRIDVLTRENIGHISREKNYSLAKIKKIGWKPKAAMKKRIWETIEELKEELLLE
ncbi:MAG: NAD-dependent epimerase/dehydratase family protein [Candidatus Diapherotrites archaeon]|nr:NAD-dependent epimerase/dehydratase family protein [Candidatus Diapherotrites archaeon]